MKTTANYTETKKATDGKEFTLTGVKAEDKKWYILEDGCGVARTRQATTKTMLDLLDNMIEDYEYDNNLR